MQKNKVQEIETRVRFEPTTGGSKKSPTLPFHILFCGNLTPKPTPSEDWSHGQRILRFDKSVFADQMEKLCLELHIDVDSQIDPQPKKIAVNLKFPSIKSFRPESILEQVPILKQLQNLGKLLRKFDKNQLAPESVKSHVVALGFEEDLAEGLVAILSDAGPTRSKSESQSQSVLTKKSRIDSLLDMVDAAGEKSSSSLSSDRGKGLIALLSQAASRTKGLKSSGSAVAVTVDRIVSEQLAAILHDPQFQALEQAWRSLKFLTERTNFQQNIILSVLPVDKSQLNEAIYHQIMMPIYEDRAPEWIDAPFSVAIADYEFSHTPVDIEQLDDLADTMSRLQFPIVAGASPNFFGKQRASDLARLSTLWQRMSGNAYAMWNGFRMKPISSFLALTLPRFLLRFPYGENNPVKKFPFDESNYTGSEKRVTGNSAVLLSVIMARSYAQTGWPTRITGLPDAEIENLPVYEYRVGGRKSVIPLEVIIRESKLAEFSDVGFIALGCRPNRDSAHIMHAATTHLPERYEKPTGTEQARLHATLTFQLCSARVAAYMLRFQQELASGLLPEEIESILTQRFQALLEIDDEKTEAGAIHIEAQDHPEKQGYYGVGIRLVIPARIVGRDVGMMLGIQVKK
ncbi:MAG: hypothetical protein B6244_07245 [Candidatus Cloacimonetes bacterium 4572_55]|nr:MAG: hypothetical protein B6244_07245 [Candidatus Cloacimonetes bacterium 4572_55]